MGRAKGLRLPDRSSVLAAAAASAASLIAGASVTKMSVSIMIGLAAVIGLVVVSRKPAFGAIAVVALPFLVFGSTGGGGIRIYVVGAAFALGWSFWKASGAPRVATSLLVVALLYAAWVLLVTWYHAGLNAGAGTAVSLRHALWVALIPAPGLLLGATLRHSDRARSALLWAGIPLALLAYAELLGFNNPFPGLEGEPQQTLATTIVQGAARAQSTFGSPLIAGDCFAVLFAMALFSRVRYSTPLAAVYAGAALCTVSRSAILGMLVAVLCGILINERRLVRILQFLGIGLVAIVLIFSVPALTSSVGNRVGNLGASNDGGSYAGQSVRLFGVNEIQHLASADPTTLLFGHGVGASSVLLAQNDDAPGYDIFDNEYLTWTYDLGAIPLVAIVGLLVGCLWRSTKRMLQFGLPAVFAFAVVMYFTDALYWPSAALLFWACLSFAVAPPDADDGDPAAAGDDRRLVVGPRWVGHSYDGRLVAEG